MLSLISILSAVQLCLVASAYEVKPFQINIPSSDVARMMNLASNTRIPSFPQFVGGTVDKGITRDSLESLRTLWTSDAYDWEKEQQELNRYSHYTVEIEGISLHFVHEKSNNTNAIPLLMAHGWPGSFHEYLPTIEGLTSEEGVSFDVVIPSLPGFTFSSLSSPDWVPEDTSRIFNTLMVDVLGYERYMVFGNDWGSSMTYTLYTNYTDHVGAAMFAFVPFLPPTADELVNLTLSPFEQHGVELTTKWINTGRAYFDEQATKPNTIGLALQDSPVGQLAWIASLFYEWSDPHLGTGPSVLTNTTILTSVSLYYLSQSFLSAAWIYTTGTALTNYDVTHPSTPMGYSAYKWGAAHHPRSYIEKVGNLTFYQEHEFGGHFPGLDNPAALVDDLKAFAAEFY